MCNLFLIRNVLFINRRLEGEGMSMDDEELIKRAVHGDLVAYGELIQRYSQTVERFAYQIGNSPNDIADIQQEVFIRIYRFLDQFQHGRFTTWLYKITLNVSRDFVRNYIRYQTKEAMLQEQVDQSPTISNPFLKREEDRMLHDCIQELDDLYRIPLILYYFHDRKQEEIADVLGTNVSTIKVRLLRARSQLKERLEKLEEMEGQQNG